MKSKLIYFLFFTLLSIFMVSGCMVGKKYTEPKAPVEVAYRNAQARDTSKLIKWFELYRDTVLQNLVTMAIDSNRDMLTAAARIEEARAETAVIKADLYPKLDYQVQAGGGRAGTEALKVSSGVEGGYLSAAGVLSWELDVWGRLRRSNKAAYAQFIASIDNRNALQVSLVAEVATQYFLLRDLDNRMLIASQTLARRQEDTKVISDRFDHGYVPKLDLLMATQQQIIAASEIPFLKRQIIETENALRLLIGKSPGAIDRGLGNFEQSLSPNIPVGMSSQLLARRPDIMEAEKNLEAQFERIGIAQANRLPTISLTGLLGVASPQLSTFVSGNSFVANGFGSLFGPLFNFGKNKKLVEVERKRTDEVYFQYQGVVLGAFRDVDNSLAAYRTLTDEYALRQQQVETSTQALLLSRARYRDGFTPYIEVSLLENVLFDAQLQASITLQQKLNSIVSLYKSLGGGWNTPQ